jgi:putative transposase
MKSDLILKDNYYHVYNRGNARQVLFYDNADYSRFLFLLLHLQSPVSFDQAGRHVKKYLTTNNFGVAPEVLERIIGERFIKVLNFCLMPNHFHVTLQSVSDDGVSRYMQKLGIAYSKYFNKKYGQSGHVFQGGYKAKLVTTDRQFVYLSAYIHRNPQEIEAWENHTIEYPWSSYQDYHNNRWGELLVPDDIVGTFASPQEYSLFVENSGAKEVWEEV